MKKEIDDMTLQAMLNQTQYRKPETNSNEHWFSFANQKQLTFHLAANLFVVNDMTPDEAIEEATYFVNKFYHQVMNPKTFNK